MSEWKESDFRLLAEHCSDVIARVGADFVYRYVSPSVERVFRRRPEDIVGHPALEFILPEDLPVVAEAIARHDAGLVDRSVVAIRVIRGDGSIIWAEVSSVRVDTGEQGETFERILVMRDITERKQLEEQLTRLAMRDGLTGLANRRAFDEALARDWRQAGRQGGAMSLLLLDIDRFKQLNDAYGHQVGDDCLRSVAGVVERHARRPHDTAARYGGEEMAMILPATGAPGALGVAEGIRTAVLALNVPHCDNPAASGRLSVSVGVATAPEPRGGGPDAPDALLKAADEALYAAKRRGRNRVLGTVLAAQAA